LSEVFGVNYRIPAGRELRVAISGRSGCGNTTVSRLLASRLGVECVNFTFRSLAAETGVPLAEIIERAKADDSFDRAVDTRQVELARRGSCVLGSRLAIWMLDEADLKVYLTASEEVRARRILEREGGDIAEIARFTAMRDAEDTGRYRRLYGIDNTDFSHADLVVDTESRLPDAIVELILGRLEERGLVERA